ncbi:phosphotyrosine interaction domain protein [Necator americanus]|uniref:Phosphotyrosine interaction domain protein n=1 Tax=Necator americanus TaxID=51031 RepID=W2SNA1_NECAM|nr:phosphotyrosine interaction domain protein [Necator americanus]ETN71140.1 phosphotyrosine interaction domain protein [Necator americanus]
MTSKGKDLYKTFKRSISSSVNEVLSSSSQSTSGSSGAKYGDVLLNGRVEYSVKFFGSQEVKEAKGTEVIRDAIHAIQFQNGVKRFESTQSGNKLQKVDIQINVEGVTIVDSKTKMALHRYPLQKISFCADDKQDKRIFSFIAKSESDPSKHECYVFLSDKMAEQITLTVGEAFDLAYKRYMDKNKTSLENQKQIFVLRKRIAELEAENQVLSERLAEAIRANKAPQLSLLDAPALPSSPMPSGPPPGLANNARHTNVTPATHYSPSGPAPSQAPPPCPVPTLAPPPPVAPRRHHAPSRANSAPVPEVGRRLQNLQLENMEDVFDDSFDPRADDKSKKQKEYDPFGDDFLDDILRTGDTASRTTLARADAAQPTADDFQKMIDKVDKRLAEMSSGFSEGRLEMGQVSPGESLGDLDENEYGTPVDKVNSVVMTGKKA